MRSPLPAPAWPISHLGEILWGNIGASDRLGFTAIGPAVNAELQHLAPEGVHRPGDAVARAGMSG